MLLLARVSRRQALLAWGTFVATLATAPHVEYGVLFGVGMSGVGLLWRKVTGREVDAGSP